MSESPSDYPPLPQPDREECLRIARRLIAEHGPSAWAIAVELANDAIDLRDAAALSQWTEVQTAITTLTFPDFMKGGR